MTEASKRHRGQRLYYKPETETAWQRLRVERGLSITDLAERTGIKRPYVALILSGRMVPTTEQAGAILAVLSGPETL